MGRPLIEMPDKICKICGAYNPSGHQLPENCWKCKQTVEAIAKKKGEKLNEKSEQTT